MLSTARLTIELASDAAMEALIRAEADAGLKAAYAEMLAGSRAHPAQRAWYAVWQLRRKDAPELPIGELCFKGLDADGVVELGYGIHPAYAGQGYATEAVAALARWAAACPGVRAVEAETAPENRPSQRVLRKAGFAATGSCGAEGPRFVWRPADAQRAGRENL